jgi:hypothetical protein
MFTKLSAIKMPESANVHCLCLERVTSRGNADKVEATDAPDPASTKREGRAQHKRVPTDVKSEK